uniref:Uncharacterized protein n=1 Tax=Anguilla anguilla TaxID=7936 RepID=A0A0E9PGV2_ANGAN
MQFFFHCKLLWIGAPTIFCAQTHFQSPESVI